MKIAMITSGYYPVIDGVTVSIHNRMKILSLLGHQVLLICPDYQGLSVYSDPKLHSGNIMQGIFVCNVPSKDFSGIDFERNMRYSANKVIEKELEAFSPDIIHVDEPERLWSGLLKRPGIAYARKHNIPSVAVYHTNFIDYAEDFIKAPDFVLNTIKFGFEKLVKFIYNSYDMTIVPGLETQKKLISLFGIENTQLEIINGVDKALFSSGSNITDYFFQQKYQIQGIDNKIKLIFIGRLTEDKNWHFTMKVFPRLIKHLDDRKIAIFVAGDGPMKKEIEDQLSSACQHVYMFGRISQEELNQVLKHCDIHISTSNKENRSLTPIEAMSAGVPVIAPTAGGFIDDITDGFNGFLFEPDNQDDFIEKCSNLIDNDELRSQMKPNAVNYAEKFEWELCVNRLLSHWGNLIASKKKTVD